MALDLTLKITADASQAQAALRQVEQGIQKVDTAAQKSSTNQATWWQKEENAIEGVTETLTAHKTEVSKVEQAVASLTGMTTRTETTMAKLGGTTAQTTSALSGMSGGAESAATALLGMLGAGELSVGALTALAGAAGVALAGLIAFGAFLVKSALYYEQHAEAAKGLRDELGKVEQAWNDIQFVVGGALMEGANAPLVQLLKLGTEWATSLGLKLAADIMLLRELGNGIADRLPGGAGRRERREFDDALATMPDPTKVLGGAPGSYLTWAASGAGAYSPLSGATALAEFDRQQAAEQRAREQLRRQLEREAQARARLVAQIEALVSAGPGPLAWGFPNRMPGTPIDMAAAGFQYVNVPRLNYSIGLGGMGVPGTPVDTSSWLAGVLRKPGLGDRLLGGLTGTLGGLLQNIFVQRGDTGSAFGAGIGGSIFGTLMGGGSGKAISGALSSIFGKTIGSAIGGFIPFGGEILGSLIGKLFGPTQYQQQARQANTDIAALWASMNKQYGGDASQALSIFGFDAASLKGKNFQGAMGLDPLRAQFDELQKRQSRFNDDLGSTLSKISALGGNVGSALLPYLQQLQNAKVLTQDNIDLIAQLSGENKVDFAQMEEAAKRLGVSTDNLGQSFQNAKAEAQWQSVIDDLDTLKRGGADLNALFDNDTGLQKTINDLANQSIKFGTTIPENMKPWIQKLIDSGKLIGENGEKIEDINKLKFGETMQTSLDNLNETLKRLIEALNVGLPNATKKAGDAWRDNLGDLPAPGGGKGGREGIATDQGSLPPGAQSLAFKAPARIELNGRQLWAGLLDVKAQEGM